MNHAALHHLLVALEALVMDPDLKHDEAKALYDGLLALDHFGNFRDPTSEYGEGYQRKFEELEEELEERFGFEVE